MPTRRAFLAAIAAGTAGCAGGVPTIRLDTASQAAIGAEEADARLGFTGDVMLARNVNERWKDGPPAGVWDTVADRLQALDGLFVNLECCLSDRGERRPGRTYYFRADPDWAISALNAAGVTWASLANNHVLDYGPVALADTRDRLVDAGIAHAGAGPGIDAAIEPSVVTVNGLRVAVVAFTDRSPTYGAGAANPGTAYASLSRNDPFTRVLVGRALQRAHETNPDLLIASLHWGPNWDPTPAPGQRWFARWLIDRGVDVVHGHSAHIPQGVESYRGRPIVYDAGDFVDDYVRKPELHNERSFLFELRIVDGRVDALELVPVEIANRAVHRAAETAAAWLRDRMQTLSEPFGTTVERAGAGLVVPLNEEDAV